MKKYLILLLLALFWSPSFLFIGLGLRGFGPVTIVALRTSIGALLLCLFMRARGVPIPRHAAALRGYAMLGIVGTAVPFLMYSVGEQFAASGLAAIINGTTPIFTLLFAHWMTHDDRLSIDKSIGIALGVGGIVLLFVPELRGTMSGARTLTGLAMFIFAPVGYALSAVYARTRMNGMSGMSSLAMSAGQLIVAAAALIPAALVFERPFSARPPIEAVGSVLALGSIGTAIAYVIYYDLLEQTNATFVSLTTFLIPPGGIALGMIVLGERPGWNAFFGCGLILSGIFALRGGFSRSIRRARKTLSARSSAP